MARIASSIALCLTLGVPSAFGQAAHTPPNTDNSYPPVLITWPVSILRSSATLRFSMHPTAEDALLNTFSSSGLTYTNLQLQVLLEKQGDLRSMLSIQKFGIDAAESVTDTAIDSIFPEGLELSGIFGKAAEKGISTYFNKKRADIDAQLAENLQANLGEIPRAGANLTAGDIRRYSIDQGDGLLGTTTVQKLQQQGASTAEINAILADEIDRITRIMAKGSTQGPPPSDSTPIPPQTSAGQRPSETDDNGNAEFLLFEQRTEKTLGELADSQKATAAAVKSVDDRTKQDHLAIAEMYDIMYSQLPASTQKKHLLAVIGTRQPTNSQTELLQLLDMRETFEEDIPKVKSAIKAMRTIAATVGLPPEYQQSLADTERKIDAFDSLGKTVLTFSPFEAFADMTTLFGGNLPDIESERFSILFSELSEIRKNQLVMMNMLAQLDEHLSQLSRQIERVDTDVAQAALLIRENTEGTAGLRDCAVLDETLNAPGSPYTFPDGTFKSFETRKQHYTSNKQSFDNCLAALKRTFLVTDDLSQLFQLDSLTDTAGKPITFEWADRYRHVLELIISYANASQLVPIDQDKFLDRLFVNALHPHSLNDIPSLASLSSGDPDTSSFLRNAERHYLAVAMVYKYIHYLTEFYPYFVFLNGKDQLQEPNVLLAAAHSDTAKEILAIVTKMLVSALRIVNTAIAQQELLDSSLTLPAINHAILSWKWADSDFCAHAYEVSPTHEQDQINGIKKAFHDLMAANEDTLQLLASRPALLHNWSRELTLETLNDPKSFNDQTPANFMRFWGPRVSTPIIPDMIGFLVDARLSNESAAQTRFSLKCNGLVGDLLFPWRWFDGTTAMNHYGSLDLSIDPNNPIDPFKFDFDYVSADFPTTFDKSSYAVIAEQHESETYVLLSLRRMIVASLVQLHGFDNLTSNQRKLAAYLIIHSAD